MTKKCSGPLLLLPYPDTREAASLRSVTLGHCPGDFFCSCLYLLVQSWCTGEAGLPAALPRTHLHRTIPSGGGLLGFNKSVILFYEFLNNSFGSLIP